jgi:hypothetical protein
MKRTSIDRTAATLAILAVLGVASGTALLAQGRPPLIDAITRRDVRALTTLLRSKPDVNIAEPMAPRR